MSKPTTVSQKHEACSWREWWYKIIVAADTPTGKLFDVMLPIAILFRVLVVMSESVVAIREASSKLLVREE